VKLILRYLRRHLGIFLTSLFFLSVEAAADLLQPTFMARIVDRGVKSADTGEILRCGAVMLAIAAAGALGAVMRNLFASRTSQTIAMELRGDLYRKIQTLSLENIDHLQPAALITRITNDVTQIQEFINGSMRIMIKAPLTCAGAVTLIILQTPQQIPVMIVILVIAAGLIAGNMKTGYPRFGRLQKRLDRLNDVSREFLTSIRVVKAFHAEAREREKFEDASRSLAEAGTQAMRTTAVFSPLINLTVNLGIVVLLWRSGSRDGAPIGRLMASVNYMTQVLFALSMVSGILNTAVRAMASSRRVAEILEETSAQSFPAVSAPPVRQGAVEFENVSFSYAGAGTEALHRVSFRAEPGETLGIIGPTGAGKSTLVGLVPRFYDAGEGRVLVDGQDVTKMDAPTLRGAIGVVSQKALLFSGTVAENLRWGRADAGADALRRAICTACADDFIREGAEGYDTPVEQGGVNLSGGQKQRLALARALVRRPRILILDDCTSALDAATEAAVLEGLRREERDVTVLLVSQRISTVMRADRILCLEDGEVRGLGTHRELLAACPAYQAIYASQIGGEEDA